VKMNGRPAEPVDSDSVFDRGNQSAFARFAE
jgi:hypothetical protein